MMRNPKFQFVVGLAISAFFLYLTLRPVNFNDLWGALKTFEWLWSVPFLVLTFLSMWLRAVRWHYLMRPLGQFSSRRLFSPMMAGFALNSIYPGRVGEFARAYVLAAREKLPFTSVFATIVLERIFDSITLLLLLVWTFANLQLNPSDQVAYGKFVVTGQMLQDYAARFATMCAILLVVAVSFLFNKVREVFCAVVLRVPFLPKAWRERLAQMVHTFAGGFSSLLDVKAIIWTLLLSIGVWVLVGASMSVLAYGFPGMKMTLMQGIAVTVITCVAILIPAAPGYWGLMEVGIIFGMFTLKIDTVYSRALAYAFVCHALQIFPIIGVGLACLWRERISLSEIRERSVTQ